MTINSKKNSNSQIQSEILKPNFENLTNKINQLIIEKDKKEVKFDAKPLKDIKPFKDTKAFINNRSVNTKSGKEKIERKPYKPYKDNKLLDPSEFSIVEEENINKKKYVSKKGFIGENRRKPIKIYEDEYEREQDFKINIFKKNRYATPYFQEKKRRNDFYGKKGKPKVEDSWKKKKKH